MFGIDIETFNTLWPSLVIVALMIGVMGWTGVKVMRLIADSNPIDSYHNGMTHIYCSAIRRLVRLGL